MAIIQNVACPACQESSHDKTGNHLMVFEDGAQYCGKAHFHKSGAPLYIAPDGTNPVLDMEINGTIKYTADQFEELKADGKLDSPLIRAMALSGMRTQDRLLVANEDETALMLKERDADHEYYEQLKTRNLISRHIRGEIAKFYGIRVGLDVTGKKVERHYYPAYTIDGEWQGAKCRTLPKEFAYGHLGWTHGDLMMFGQNTVQSVMDSGERKNKLMIVGGELDAAAALQMIVDSRKGTKWANQMAHVWSPNKGEASIEEIILNKEAINQFKEIVVATDDDKVGRELCVSIAKLFRGKVKRLVFPAGMKDPNDCLMHGKTAEFIDAWFNPIDPFAGGKFRAVADFADDAKEAPVMGLSWPWPDLDPITFGIGLNRMTVWGAGSGVGKTQVTKEIVDHLTQFHNEQVGVIYLEERPKVTTRSYAGLTINKDLNAPPSDDKTNPNYLKSADYTKEQADGAIDKLASDNKIIIGDLEGRKDVDSVISTLEEGIARGIQYFIVDNLTAFEHAGKDGKQASKTEAIDETMRRLGTLKDENPIHIVLISHLKKVQDGEGNSHAEGAEVRDDHFRGAGSITFWADGTFGIERNTQAERLEDKVKTTIRNIKNRTVGHKTGSCVQIKMDLDTGRLVPDVGYVKPVQRDNENFDTGEGDDAPAEF